MATSSEVLQTFRESRGDDMEVDDLVTELGYDGEPVSKQRSLAKANGSLRMTIQKSAWQAAGVDYDDPGEVTQIWLPGADIVITDLSSGGD